MLPNGEAPAAAPTDPTDPTDSTLFSADKYALESKSIREALYSVSIYNGDSQSVEAFLHEVMSLFRTVQMDEEIFTRLLIVNRLTGRAREAFDNGNITNNLLSFAETLRQRFKQTRSYEALTNQRARMVQKNETVLEFTTRFKKMQRDIILSVLNNDLFSSDGKKDLINNEETLNCLQYVRGLLPEIRERVQPMRPSTIEEAYSLAQQARDDLSLNRATDTLRSRTSNVPRTGIQQQGNKGYNRRSPDAVRRGNSSLSTTQQSPRRATETSPRQDTSSQGATSRPTHSSPIKCFTCGGPHVRARCPLNNAIRFAEEVDFQEPSLQEASLDQTTPTLEEVFFAHTDNDEVICVLDFPSGPKTFLIDTGARINLIKASATAGCPIEHFPSYLLGISGTVVGTNLKATHGDHVFHIINEDFPLQTDGLLGRS
jgi:hypothetical protein